MDMMNLKLADIVKTAKFLAQPGQDEIINEAVKAVEDYPSNYNMGVLLRALGSVLLED